MGIRVVRYSEAFKLDIVSKLESGELPSIDAAWRRYGIGGHLTVKRWLRKYGKTNLLPKVVRVEMPNEKDKLKDLQQENDRLKKALADSHMDAVLHRSWLQVACEEFGVPDVEAFKKKHGGKP